MKNHNLNKRFINYLGYFFILITFILNHWVWLYFFDADGILNTYYKIISIFLNIISLSIGIFFLKYPKQGYYYFIVSITNSLVFLGLICSTEIILLAFEKPKLEILGHKEFRSSIPEPYKNSHYISDSFLDESFQENFWETPPNTRIVIPKKRNIKGKYINVLDYLRLTTDTPVVYDQRIFMFGGSTVFCSEVPDSFTICSFLQREINKNHYSTRVFNYGATSVNVKQQLERFHRDIKIRKQDIVIFYDGVNDVIQGVYHGNSDGWIVGNNRKTHYLIILLRKYKKYSAILRFFNKELTTAPNITDENIHLTSRNYFDVISKMDDILRENNGNFYHFLQPHLFTKQSHNNYEKKLEEIESIIPVNIPRALIETYPHLVKTAQNLEFSYDLSSVLDTLKQSPYLDFCHINEYGNRIIASNIFNIVKNDLVKLSSP